MSIKCNINKSIAVKKFIKYEMTRERSKYLMETLIEYKIHNLYLFSQNSQFYNCPTFEDTYKDIKFVFGGICDFIEVVFQLLTRCALTRF